MATDSISTPTALGVDYLLTFTTAPAERSVRLALDPVVTYLRRYQDGYRFNSLLGPTSLKVRLQHALTLTPDQFQLRSTSAAFDRRY